MNSNLIANKKTIQFLIVLILGVALGLITILISREEFSCDNSGHLVAEGDTLWAIAEQKCSGNIQKATDTAMKTYGTDLVIGTTIFMPSHHGCSLIWGTDGSTYEKASGDIYENCREIPTP